MNVLVIAAHPDDETLGCGGTILRHRKSGDTVHWVVATETYPPLWDAAATEAKGREVDVVAEAYGVTAVHRLKLPTIRLDGVPLAQVIDGLRQAVERSRPEVVYVTHHGDVHSDHAVVASATLSVLKAFNMRRLGVRRVLSYETLSSTEAAPPYAHRVFAPTVFHDITPHLERKVQIMSLYASELQADPLPRGPSAVRALARYRGAAVGVESAEAFVLVREVS